MYRVYVVIPTPLRLFSRGIFFHGVTVNLIYEKGRTKKGQTPLDDFFVETCLFYN